MPLTTAMEEGRYSNGYPASSGKCLDWLAQCQYTVTEITSSMSNLLPSPVVRTLSTHTRHGDRLYFACYWDFKQTSKKTNVAQLWKGGGVEHSLP